MRYSRPVPGRRRASGAGDEIVGGGDDPISAEALYPRWEKFLAPGDTIIAETGTSSMGLAFARLPAECRAVVRRAHYYGWNTAQIGADLGIAEGTVKSRLHDALRTLQQTLREMGVAQ